MTNLKRKLKRTRERKSQKLQEPILDHWIDNDGMHFIAQGDGPTEEDYAKMTKAYQARIKNSPMWNQWVKQFGKAKAEEMLKECIAKPGIL